MTKPVRKSWDDITFQSIQINLYLIHQNIKFHIKQNHHDILVLWCILTHFNKVGIQKV